MSTSCTGIDGASRPSAAPAQAQTPPCAKSQTNYPCAPCRPSPHPPPLRPTAADPAGTAANAALALRLRSALRRPGLHRRRARHQARLAGHLACARPARGRGRDLRLPGPRRPVERRRRAVRPRHGQQAGPLRLHPSDRVDASDPVRHPRRPAGGLLGQAARLRGDLGPEFADDVRRPHRLRRLADPQRLHLLANRGGQGAAPCG